MNCIQKTGHDRRFPGSEIEYYWQCSRRIMTTGSRAEQAIIATAAEVVVVLTGGKLPAVSMVLDVYAMVSG